ncbi:MAG: epoxide hydrolase [Chitinophaga sp.]|uniref:epoxide hydrolase family protein n=1 Tax=Chitinophaga sp. TaxID=1869181 RepID=UPI001B2AB9EE|nr:epoxide hydrolase family protein [Chitinophaga sp.]MBO9731422.1 epoxide hydrolase [Chitinophaga sp.]
METGIVIKPMRIYIPEEDIVDLHYRLRHTRWVSPMEDATWEDGTSGEYLRDLAAYWLSGYNWREREARLNKFDHYQATIGDSQLHFIHAKGEGPDPIPLLLMQGWPGSFVQLLPLIPLLTAARTDGTPSFDVVAMSMPGYPFSSIPRKHGMNFKRIADLIVPLMTEGLGYERFACRGSDQGALVQQQIGLHYPERVIGLHRSGITPFMSPMPADLSEAEVAYQQKVAAWAPTETLYARIQALRPETLTPALADSPVGLASWFIEKFQRWGDGGEQIDQHFGRDELLDNISLHWFTGAGAAAIRSYKEAVSGTVLNPEKPPRVAVPSAIMMPLHDGVTVPAPREWAERTYNVQRWTIMEQGGHFPEWEVPGVIAADVRQFFGDRNGTITG